MRASDADGLTRNQAAHLRDVWPQRATCMPTSRADEHGESWRVEFAQASLDRAALQQGYATPDRRHRVCARCFDEFRTDFEWVCHEP